jgi:hypothetical protein
MLSSASMPPVWGMLARKTLPKNGPVCREWIKRELPSCAAPSRNPSRAYQSLSQEMMARTYVGLNRSLILSIKVRRTRRPRRHYPASVVQRTNQRTNLQTETGAVRCTASARPTCCKTVSSTSQKLHHRDCVGASAQWKSTLARINASTLWL